MLRRVGLLIVLLAVMVVMTGTVQATPRMAGPKQPPAESGILERLRDWLFALLHPATPGNNTRSIWEAEGSHWDPNGNP